MKKTYQQKIAPEIVDKIRNSQDELTRSQKVVAEYMIHHPENVGMLPISELAGRIGVSEPTVVRFCRALGYTGYAELGREVQKAINYELSTIDRFRRAGHEDGPGHAGGNSAFERVISQEINNIGRLTQSVTKTDFYRLVDWMEAADHLLISGFMASEALAQYFHYAVSKLLPSVDMVTAFNAESSNCLRAVTENSLVVLMAFPRYPRATVELGRLVKKAGCKVAAITDSHHSPLVEIADLVLLSPISLKSIADNYSAPLTLIMALVCELAERDPRLTEKSLAYFEGFVNTLDLWIKPLTRKASNLADDQSAKKNLEN